MRGAAVGAPGRRRDRSGARGHERAGHRERAAAALSGCFRRRAGPVDHDRRAWCGARTWAAWTGSSIPTATDPALRDRRAAGPPRVPEERITVFPSQAAAWAAAAAGGGCRSGDRAPLDADQPPGRRAAAGRRARPTRCSGTSTCSAATDAHPSPAASTGSSSTPDAIQAMYRADGGVPASQFRPPVYVTIWS